MWKYKLLPTKHHFESKPIRVDPKTEIFRNIFHLDAVQVDSEVCLRVSDDKNKSFRVVFDTQLAQSQSASGRRRYTNGLSALDAFAIKIVISIAIIIIVIISTIIIIIYY